MKTKRTTRKPADLFEACEGIVSLAEDSKLGEQFYDAAEENINFVAERLELSGRQAVIMALFMNNADDEHIRLKDLSMLVGASAITMMRYLNDIDVLIEKEYIIRRTMGREAYYRIPNEVIECFRKNEKFVRKDLTGLTCQELFLELSELIKNRSNGEASFEVTQDRIMRLMGMNNHLQFVQKVQNLDLIAEDLMLLLVFCILYSKDYDDNITFRDYRFLFDDSKCLCRVKKELSQESHALQIMQLVEFNCEDGFVNRDSFRLTMNAKMDLLGELNLPILNNVKKQDSLLLAEDITPKDLFYDEKTSKQVEELAGLLGQENYVEIRKRMKDAGFHSGFACLLYGEPGTGKTETVLQLARRTGRAILRVDISLVKSMWVGESEKNIKAVFDIYRRKVRESNIAPILLFNEADGILGIRKEGADKSVDKMENSIQNIILQEMEELDGIFIATTNLEQNLDKAFERRFLYKIRFEKPTADARKNIWKSMIPTIAEEDALLIAKKYDFSGGLIENVSRRFTIDSILYGKPQNQLNKLFELCEQEKMERKANKIGF